MLWLSATAATVRVLQRRTWHTCHWCAAGGDTAVSTSTSFLMVVMSTKPTTKTTEPSRVIESRCRYQTPSTSTIIPLVMTAGAAANATVRSGSATVDCARVTRSSTGTFTTCTTVMVSGALAASTATVHGQVAPPSRAAVVAGLVRVNAPQPGVAEVAVGERPPCRLAVDVALLHLRNNVIHPLGQ